MFILLIHSLIRSGADVERVDNSEIDSLWGAFHVFNASAARHGNALSDSCDSGTTGFYL